MTKDKQLKWKPYVGRNISLTLVILIYQTYLKEMKKEIGWNFKETLVISKKGAIKSYRSNKEIKDLANFIKRQIKYDSNFITTITTKAKKIADEATAQLKNINNELKQQLSRKELLKIFNQLQSIFKNFWSIQLFPHFVEYSLIETKNETVLQKYKKILSFSREQTHYQEAAIEKAIDTVAQKTASLAGIKSSLAFFLTPQEIKNFLSKNKLINQNKLIERSDYYILITKGGKLKLYTGELTPKIESQELKSPTITKQNKISGTPANPGEITAKVRVIIFKKDLNNLEEGEIVVSPMTEVDFVPYLKKAGGIVTDEGGVTCHAAIISRELNIPCVIGTKIATRVLKNGNLIKMDANKGIVKIL